MTRLEAMVETLVDEVVEAFEDTAGDVKGLGTCYNPVQGKLRLNSLAAARAVAARRIRELACDFDCGTQGPLNRYLDGAAAAKGPPMTSAMPPTMLVTFPAIRQLPYRVARYRPDWWPICPCCDEDELYSLTVPAATDTICGCYRCGPCSTEVVDNFLAASALREEGPSSGREGKVPVSHTKTGSAAPKKGEP